MTDHQAIPRRVGTVTTAAATGGGVGAALVQVAAYVWPYLDPIQGPLTVLAAAGLAVLGGYLVPPSPGGRHAEQ